MNDWPPWAVTRLAQFLRTFVEDQVYQEDLILHNEIDPSDYYSI